MGKKDKNKKKVSGSVKTALKTEKKLNAKQKKELAALGEDDIEKIVADLEREETRRQRIVEKTVDPPSRRVNFTLTAHPCKDELIMLGGEFHDGQKTVVYGDMFLFNLNKQEWMLIKAPGAPPPRCGHQAVATATNKGELWIFGGEFSSPSESQFYHYKDLWVYRMGEKKWEKIQAPGGPSARSGHRMACIKKQLIIFGGFHDNLRDYKYYNDVHVFNLETYTWRKLDPSGNLPAPRSGCIVQPTPDSKLLVYGGYSKEKVKKDVDKGCIHTDMYLLTPDKNDSTGCKWKWILQKQSGNKPSARCSASGILIQPNMAYIFGGVYDNVDDEEDLTGTFYNDLLSLDMEKYEWHTVSLTGKKHMAGHRKRRKPKEGDDNCDMSGSDSDCSTKSEENKTSSTQDQITHDDGIFTVTVGPAITSNTCTEKRVSKDTFTPMPRINPGLVTKHNTLYLYGGMVEVGDKQYTLSDFYSLDCRKLDEWKTLISDDLTSQPWFDSESSDDSEHDTDDSEDESNEEHHMEVDEN